MLELPKTQACECAHHIPESLIHVLTCRKYLLKKCDCAHPVCSQCTRFGREKDCEYPDKDHRSRTEVLEENIAILKARLKEFEHSGQHTDCSPVQLTRPVWSVESTENLTDLEMFAQESMYSLGVGSSTGEQIHESSHEHADFLYIANVYCILPFCVLRTAIGAVLPPNFETSKYTVLIYLVVDVLMGNQSPTIIEPTRETAQTLYV